MKSVGAAGVLVAASLLVGVGNAGAAGITTHQWMARTAIPKVSSTQLRALLAANIDMVNAGAGFPDVGYVGSNTYGETAHWQRFIDNMIDAIRVKPGCGDMTDPTGPCAGLIAFTFGAAAHGMGDQVWDWLFEPNSPDRNEYWTGVPTATNTGAETQMDLVAIGRYGVGTTVSETVPDIPMVIQALSDSGEPGVAATQFDLVDDLPQLWQVEKNWADAHLSEVEAAMPWMSANLVTAPGGVNFAATAIAGYWDSEWGRLLGNQPATRVSITYPSPDQTGIPATGWDRDSFEPGTAPGRGGAQNRIAAALTSSRPYKGSPAGFVSDAMPAGSMTITDVASGAPVPIKDGYPRSVPYGSDAGEHMIDVQPASNLAECTWYQVDVGRDAQIVDARGQAVTPYSWKFKTACAGETSSTTTTTFPPIVVGDTAEPTTSVVGEPSVAPVANAVREKPTYTG